MLDSYVDQAEDARNGDHSYVAHYPSRDSARRGVQRLLARSTTEVRALPRGPKHAIIAAAMAAMYLSKAAESSATRTSRRRLARAGGSLTRLLLPILRAWRIAYAQRGALLRPASHPPNGDY